MSYKLLLIVLESLETYINLVTFDLLIKLNLYSNPNDL